jgi:DeoR/GlpR family transcriptional regulator of sugar metabolism
MHNGISRAEYILQELQHHGHIDAEQLSQQLHVNASTIRRDLEKMERQRLLRRVHGGAVPADTLSYSAYADDLTFQKNMEKHGEEKTRIASAALKLIHPGDTIALSPGTTTTRLAQALRQSPVSNITVVTNAVNIAMELSGIPEITVTLVGGLLLPDFFALVGPLAEQALSQMYVAKAFIGVTGLSLEYGLTGPNQLEALTHRLTIQRAQQTIVLADATKIGYVALHSIAPVTTMHTLVTDLSPSNEIINALHTLSIHVVSV